MNPETTINPIEQKQREMMCYEKAFQLLTGLQRDYFKNDAERTDKINEKIQLLGDKFIDGVI